MFRAIIYSMQGQAKERWLELCEQAAIEQDSAKLFQLVKEINRLLEEKENRLQKLRQEKFLQPSHASLGHAEVLCPPVHP